MYQYLIILNNLLSINNHLIFNNKILFRKSFVNTNRSWPCNITETMENVYKNHNSLAQLYIFYEIKLRISSFSDSPCLFVILAASINFRLNLVQPTYQRTFCKRALNLLQMFNEKRVFHSPYRFP